jgi:hypothetical protein
MNNRKTVGLQKADNSRGQRQDGQRERKADQVNVRLGSAAAALVLWPR